MPSLVGSEMCIRDRTHILLHKNYIFEIYTILVRVIKFHALIRMFG